MSGIFFGLASRWIRPIPPPITVQIIASASGIAAKPITIKRRD
jgi:hypothetical protein